MLDGKRIHTTLPTIDRERARAFYSEKLGFEPTQDAPGGLLYETSGGAFVLYPGAGSGGSHTQMGFTVDDIEAEIAELTSRGVVFESYDDMPGFNGGTKVASLPGVRAAWFKDSEGNLLGLVQFLS